MLWDNPNLQRISLIKEINNEMTNMAHLSFISRQFLSWPHHA